MKKIIKFLPAMAILLASGLAVATTKKMNEHNVYWDGNTWQDITVSEDRYECLPTGPLCTAYKDEDDNISNQRSGTFFLLPNP